MRNFPVCLLRSLSLAWLLLVCRTYAGIDYWDNNGLSAATSGTWDTTTPQWSTSPSFTASPIVWDPAAAAGFPVGSTNVSAFVITVNSTIPFAGIFNGLTNGANNGAGVTNLTIKGTGTLSIDSGLQGFWTGQSYFNTLLQVSLGGTGGLQNQSSGSLYLSGTNSYSGGTSVGTSAGLNFNNGFVFGTGPVTNAVSTSVLAIPATDSAGNAFATAPINVTNAWATFGGANTEIFAGLAAAPVTFSGPWTLAGAAGTTTTLDVRNTIWTISGPISGAMNLTKVNTANLQLSGANTYSGKTSINNGILTVNSLNKVTGGTTSSSLGHPTTAANGTIGIGATTTAGTLLYIGAGEITDRVIDLAGTTGGAIIQSDGSGPTTFSTALTASGAGAKTLTLQGTNAGANTIAKIIDSSSATALTKAQAGKWVLSGANTYSGATTVSAGTLAQGAANVIPSGTGKGNLAVSSGATFDMGGFDSAINGFGTSAGTIDNTTGAGTYTLTMGNNNAGGTHSGPIKNSSGTLAINKTGTGAIVLTGANTYSGKTLINGGTIQIAADTGLGTAPGSFVPDQLTLNSGAIRLNVTAASIVANRGITLGASGGTVDCTSGQSPGISSVISGAGALTKISSGNLDLLGANTFQGGFTITGGGVRFRNDNAAGTGTITVTPASIVTLRNLNPPAATTITNPVILNANGGNDIDLAAANAATFTLTGNISGVGYLTRDRGTAGNGTVVLSGSNSFSGGLLWKGSGIAIGSSNAFGTGTLSFTPANADPVVLSTTVPLTGASAVTNPVQFAVSNAAQQVTISGVNDLELSGPVSLGQLGTGSPILTNKNTGTTILSGPISGTGFGLTVTGTGKLILSGINTYDGATVLSGGTLLVNSPGSLSAASAVTAGTGTVLGGNGAIHGPVTIASGATLAPGASIGTLTLDSGPVLAGTVAMELNKAPGPVLTSDKLVISPGGGTLVFAGALTITTSGLPISAGDTFDLFDADNFSGSFSSITPTSPAPGLVWDTSGLTVDGTIKAVCAGTLTASAGSAQVTCSGSGVTIGGSPTASGGSGTGYTYSWSPSSGLNDSTLANPTASPATTTTYTVTVTDAGGCNAQASVTISVDLPPVISTQPANQAACSGTTASFSVAASGSGLAYSWAKHSNAGWGSAWVTSGGGTTFRGSSTDDDFGDPACASFSSAFDINSPSGNALGMWGGFSGDQVATRSFPALAVGQAVSIDFDNGNVDNGSKVGFSLETSIGADILQFYFLGGQANYKYNDGSEQDTGIPFQRTGLRVQFILTSSTNYLLVVTPCGGTATRFAGTYSGTIAQLKLFNQNNTGGNDKNIYFNNFIVGGYVDNADNYSGDYAGQDKGDAPIALGNGGAGYSTPLLSVGDNGTQFEVVVSGCAGTVLSSLASLTVNGAPTAGTGGNQTICAGSSTAGLGGAVGGGATGGYWASSGTGTFSPDTNTLNATYTPSPADITAGTVTVTLTTTGQLAPCTPATAQLVVTINPTATASAGGDQTICAGTGTAGLGGSVGGSATGGVWSTSGTGSFTPDPTNLNTTYTPSAADINAGSVTLTLSSTGQLAPCPAATVQVVVTINSAAVAGAGGNQTICAGAGTAPLGGSVGWRRHRWHVVNFRNRDVQPGCHKPERGLQSLAG
jgi:autotransporter-associated beta strand protein